MNERTLQRCAEFTVSKLLLTSAADLSIQFGAVHSVADLLRKVTWSRQCCPCMIWTSILLDCRNYNDINTFHVGLGLLLMTNTAADWGTATSASCTAAPVVLQ